VRKVVVGILVLSAFGLLALANLVDEDYVNHLVLLGSDAHPTLN